jgi:hypothetical protein
MPDEETHMTDRRDGWKVSKEIPISTIATLLLQTIAFIWFLAMLDKRISILEERRTDDKAAFTVITQLKEKAILTEAQVQTLAKSVERMELKLDQQRAIEETRKHK